MSRFSIYFLAVVALVCSCSSSALEEADETTPSQQPTSTVAFAMTRSSVDEYAKAGISQLTIFIYRMETSRTGVLYSEQTVDATEGTYTYSLPLDEKFTTFVVASATQVTGKDSVQTLTLGLDPTAPADVWASAPVSFRSDKSSNLIDVTLRRVVAKVDFQPAEDAASLAADDHFDALQLTFSNVSTRYNLFTSTATLGDLSLTTAAANGYQASFYTFDTTASNQMGGLHIIYNKGGQQVNTSSSVLDCGTAYAASHHYQLIVPVTSADYLAQPWSTQAKARTAHRPSATKAVTVIDTLY